MPLQATSGAASYDAFGGGVPVVPTYIEDVFSTYLYTGTGSPFTLTNGIDLSGKGGMVWTKDRTRTGTPGIIDTVRGNRSAIYPNLTGAQDTAPDDTYGITGFNSTGYGVGINYSFNINDISFGITNYVSWTFRKQPKFFDIVTYSGSNSDQTISHNLGSTPGCIMIKKLDSNTFNAGWAVYHRSLANPNNNYLVLNTTAATANYGAPFISSVSSTTFTVAGGAGSISLAGSTYVAYIFAHDAGGFGLTGTDNVISCGSFTGTSKVTLGYEPQWLLIKKTSAPSGGYTDSWLLMDTMRGLFANAPSYSKDLAPNSSRAEQTNGAAYIDATGFTPDVGGDTYIYIAIRRGPMKVPTSGTSVFAPVIRTGTSTAVSVTGVGFPPDMMWSQYRDSAGNDNPLYDKLRGPTRTLFKNSTMAEQTPASYGINSFDQDGVSLAANQGYTNNSGSLFIYDFFRRAPSFFDEVCYTGTGSNATFAHNLGVVPELMIVKRRSAGGAWMVNSQYIAADARLELQSTSAVKAPPDYGDAWNNTRPTSTVFTVSTDSDVNASGGTYVNYLFATCAGVSKCTAFTGTGTLQTINCGFTSGARFVLIKRTDSTGDWYVWDSSRGLSSSTDPYLLLNSTAAEVTSTNWVDTTSTGFQVTAASGNNVNINGASYIALAIA
jgi:hypothetical protein